VCFFIAQNSVVMTFVAFSIASFSQIISAGSCSWLGNNFWLDCVFAGVIVSQRGLERGFGLVASGGAVRLPIHILFGLHCWSSAYFRTADCLFYLACFGSVVGFCTLLRSGLSARSCR
ncbi:unnamed protein product, partial [Brassica napus]